VYPSLARHRMQWGENGGATMAGEFRELLERCGILVFAEVHFTDEEQIAFPKTLRQRE
jgi:hypothetical protein